MIKKELNKLVEEMRFFKYKPKDNHELFAGWKDDGIRDHEKVLSTPTPEAILRTV